MKKYFKNPKPRKRKRCRKKYFKKFIKAQMSKDLVELKFLVFVRLLWFCTFVHLFIHVNELTTLILINHYINIYRY
jgi:hypothetical protein